MALHFAEPGEIYKHWLISFNLTYKVAIRISVMVRVRVRVKVRVRVGVGVRVSVSVRDADPMQPEIQGLDISFEL